MAIPTQILEFTQFENEGDWRTAAIARGLVINSSAFCGFDVLLAETSDEAFVMGIWEPMRPTKWKGCLWMFPDNS